jgi:hypothetical protein
MIRTKVIEDQLRHQRLDAKSLDNLFRRRIEQGANCSPFVSGATLQTVKDVFPLSLQDSNNTLGLGRLKLLVIAAAEPAGKALEDCQKVTVTLTLDAGLDDYQVRERDGVDGLRRTRILHTSSSTPRRRSGGTVSTPRRDNPGRHRTRQECLPSFG